MILAGWLWLAAGNSIVAQPPPQNPMPSNPATKVLDGVVATVDNRVILRSEIEQELVARLESERAQGRSPVGVDSDKIFGAILREEVRTVQLAAAAKTTGGKTPDELSAIVDRYLADEQERSIEKAGSLQRFKQQFAHRSLLGERARRRDEVFKQLAEQDIQRRIGDHLALLVTPSQIHKLWLEIRPKHRRAAESTVGMLVLGHKQGEDTAAFTKRAAEIAARWRRETIAPDQLAKQVDALDHRTLRELTDAAPWIADFVGSAKPSQVSDPIAVGQSVRILKILEQQPAEEFDLSDPKVQRLLTSELIRRELQLRNRREQVRSLRKIRAWIREPDPSDPIRPGR